MNCLTDYNGNVWTDFRKLCRGGFGTIYDCGKDDRVVVKTQPARDKQLKMEEEFYSNLTKRVASQMSDYVPTFVASGVSGTVRFIVLEKIPHDVNEFLKLNKKIQKKTFCDMTVQLVAALQFLHSLEYSHGDLKDKNVLVCPAEKPILKLCDFGLVRKFTTDDGSHVPYTPGKLSYHRGTLPFTGVDSHMGAIPSRRTDLENLGWFVISCFFGKGLPWEKFSKNKILNYKIIVKSRLPDSVDKLMPGKSTKRVKSFMKIVDALNYESSPDYEELKDIFR
jgi:vaccinia related kinase